MISFKRLHLDLRKQLLLFAKGYKPALPVDSHVAPEPYAMPGYHSDVIMAAGAFVQGSSIELSADGPIEPAVCGLFPGGAYMVSCSFWHYNVFTVPCTGKPCEITIKDRFSSDPA